MAKVLLITHDVLLARAYRARLLKEQFNVQSCPTAHEGLAISRQWVPDVLLLDLTLPGMHGLDVLKSMRDVPWLSKTHVVLLIERTLEREVIDECLLWGADSCLQKDVCSLQDVVSHLRTILLQAIVAASTDTPSTSVSSDAPPA